MTEEEFSIIVEDSTDEGVLAEAEAEIIQNTIKFDETKVEKVMTKAEDITSVCITDDMKYACGTCCSCNSANKSDIPLCEVVNSTGFNKGLMSFLSFNYYGLYVPDVTRIFLYRPVRREVS